VRGAKRVHLFFSESGENDKSRFIEKLLWERQKRDGTYTSDRYVQTVHYRVRLANENVEPIPKLADVLEVLHGFTYSASALDTYLQCPIRFYYQYVLRLKEKEEVSADLDSQDIGIFIHEVLKKYYEPFIGKNLKVHDLIPEQIEQVVEKSFSQKFGAESVGAMYLLKRQIQRQLKALLNDYQKPVLETNDIVLKNLEQKITISAFGYKFEGKLDRVEQRGASDVILDYKTGVKIKKPPINFSKLDLEQRESWSGAIYSLQLPMYLLLYQMHTGMDIRHIIPAYLFIGESYLSKDSEYVFMEDMEEREAGFAQTQKLIELILREINNITVPFFPAMDLNKTCPRCPYSTLCGTSWVRGWNSK
jgi:ATP-dependent helicase/DNAse subunit B